MAIKSKQICFNANTLLFSTIIIILVVIALGISVIYLITTATEQQPTTTIIQQAPAQDKRFLKNSYNRPYRDQETIFDTDNANKVGYLYNGSGEQYPLYQYLENREYKYFVLDDSRNGNKIEVPNPNRREILYDGDKVVVPEFLGEMNVKIYQIVNTIFSSRI